MGKALTYFRSFCATKTFFRKCQIFSRQSLRIFVKSIFSFIANKFMFILQSQISTARTCQHTISCMTCPKSTSRICSPLLNPPFAHLSSGQTMSFEKTRFVPQSVIYFPTTYCLYGFYPVAFYMGITNVLYLLLLCRGHRATYTA